MCKRAAVHSLSPAPVLRSEGGFYGFEGTIDGLFSGERMISSGYFSGLNGIRSARALTNEQGRITATTDNHDIVDELRILSQQFDELSTAVRNMKIVLDTGVVAGEITEQVDGNLGVLAGRRERGN